MSGSGGGYTGGGTDNDYVDFCSAVVINTQLSSPKDDVVGVLKVGDVLLVGLQSISDNQSIVVAIHDTHVAGGITSPESNRLKQCMQEGNTYTAEITEINAGQVKVRVRWLAKA